MVSREVFVRRLFQVFFILATVTVSYVGGKEFLLLSLFFLASAGIFEFITMTRFVSEPKDHILTNDEVSVKLKNAFLWVHQNITFIEKYNTSIYRCEKSGVIVLILSYLIIFLYVVIALFLYTRYSYYGLLIYIVPIISNIFSFFKYRYLISTSR